MSEIDLSNDYSCLKNSKNPETAGVEFDEKVGRIYEDLKKSSIERQEDVAYSDGEMTKIDIWGPEDSKKLFVMIHGGYWLVRGTPALETFTCYRLETERSVYQLLSWHGNSATLSSVLVMIMQVKIIH